jgi:hypothetical protein
MTREELEGLLGGNKMSYGVVPMSLLLEASDWVNVVLDMDTSSLDYYYKISVNELLESGAPTQFVERLRDEGWALDSSKENVNIFLKL